MANFISLFTGIIFGLGLAISKMLEPQRVVGFLDVFGTWDPTLGLVMAGALLVMMFGHLLAKIAERPVYAEYFRYPTKLKIDTPLIAGSAIFGIGWGLGGFCPGPVIAATPYFNTNLMLGFVTYVVGVFVAVTLRNMRTTKVA